MVRCVSWCPFPLGDFDKLVGKPVNRDCSTGNVMIKRTMAAAELRVHIQHWFIFGFGISCYVVAMAK